MIQYITNLISFINTPDTRYSFDRPCKEKIKKLILSFIAHALLVIILAPLIGVLHLIISTFFFINLIEIRKSNIENDLASTYINPSIIICIVGPIIEELLFRIWLSFKKADIVITFFILFFILITAFSDISFYTQKPDISFAFRIGIALLVSSLLYLLLKQEYLNEIKRKYAKNLLIFSCLLFGSIHIVNFMPIKLSIVWAYPIFLLPQFIMAFILSYLRIKNGIIWSILLHILINASVISISS